MKNPYVVFSAAGEENKHEIYTAAFLVAISLFLIFLFYQGRGHGLLPLDPLLFQRR